MTAPSPAVPGESEERLRRILVTGSRDWTDGEAIEDALRPLLYEMPSAVLVHGACRGADNIASGIWRGWGGKDEPHVAAWATHGKAAGFVRNRSMVDLGADVCLAFIRNRSKGATMCADLAARAGIEVRRYESLASL